MRAVPAFGPSSQRVVVRGRSRCVKTAAYRDAGPKTDVPDYNAIDSQPLNKTVMALFRRKMVAEIGSDSHLEGYDGIIDLTRILNAKYPTPRETQVATRRILNSLFPSWLPKLFKVMFARPMPALSYKMNAYVTSLTCQWLMGPNAVNDVEVDGGETAKGQGVLIERCRYLEQGACAAICINSCKVPTQEFFQKDMGLNVTLEPNYDDFSCQFVFGKTPPPEEGDPAFQSPCFVQCPSKRRTTSGGEECGGTVAYSTSSATPTTKAI